MSKEESFQTNKFNELQLKMDHWIKTGELHPELNKEEIKAILKMIIKGQINFIHATWEIEKILEVDQ